MVKTRKPIILLTGSEGNVGSALSRALEKDYYVIGCDRPGKSCEVEMDITSDGAIARALAQIEERYGKKIAAVVHLAAYFDFSGEDSPLYETLNVQGTKSLLRHLQKFEVERFIYSGTMLVHQPCKPGQVINENTEIAPKWVYPQSKARAEEVIRADHGKIPYTILRLAGLYDDHSGIPTLTQQIARIYEENLKSHLYAGDQEAGQACIHRDDMVALFKKTIDLRGSLPKTHAVLAGEPEVMSYAELQETIGSLIHGQEKWHTLSLPKSVAKSGAWLEHTAEPAIPDAFDEGKEPFIKPFMVDRASDHYALDISKAKSLMDWQPQKRLRDRLSKMIQNLKKDPVKWYQDNGITLPDWAKAASQKKHNPENLRTQYENSYQQQHKASLWAHFLTIGLGFWLISSPFTLNYESQALTISDMVAGLLVILTGSCALSGGKWMRFSRFDTAIIGLWIMSAPLIFWAPTAASYLNGTIIGTTLFALALLVRPFPAMSPTADRTGPESPPGWDFSPSSWFQRIPVIFLAFIGFYISRYMAAYQLGHIDTIWDPFFAGAIPEDGKNGTGEIITSRISEAWPVPDAGLGALVYLLEILTGMIGSSKRWRTMPWLVLLFGFMIIPLGAVSITFIIIQPILLDTWCTLCLIAAAAMLIQIPYSFDEVVATIDFLRRKARAERPWLKILFTGDTDEEETQQPRTEDDFTQPWGNILKEIVTGGLTIPWNLALSALIGIWLMFTRLTLGSEGDMANADHLVGALVLTITVTSLAEVARPLRFLNIFLGGSLLITPFILSTAIAPMIGAVCCGLVLIALSFRRGPINSNWGAWNKAII